MGQLAVVLLALFAQMERTYTSERAAHARAVAAAHGRHVGRPSLLDPTVLAYAVHLRDAGHTMAQIVAKTGMTRSSLYRYLPVPPASFGDGGTVPRGRDGGGGRHYRWRLQDHRPVLPGRRPRAPTASRPGSEYAWRDRLTTRLVPSRAKRGAACSRVCLAPR